MQHFFTPTLGDLQAELGDAKRAGKQAAFVMYVRDDCHDRPGFPNGRDDQHWLKNTLCYKDGDRLEYKPVSLKPLTAEMIPPKARAY